MSQYWTDPNRPRINCGSEKESKQDFGCTAQVFPRLSGDYHLRNISKIRKYLTQDSAPILIHAFISSKLDYCNSLLYGIPKYLVCRLQRVQNTAARIVTLTRKYDSITPIMFKLHWLPVHSRIIFKLLLLVYKALNGKAPSYISSLLSHRKCSRSLRSSGQEPAYCATG